MKSNLVRPSHSQTPTEEEIRDYAYHLFVQRGGVHGYDIDDWLEAESALRENIRKAQARTTMLPRGGHVLRRGVQKEPTRGDRHLAA